MSRTAGSRNRDYVERREALATALIPRLLAPDGARVSARELAAAAGVSVPTLRHYFGGRAGAIGAALASMRRLGAAHIARAGHEPHGGVAESLHWYLDELIVGWERYGVGTMVGTAIAVGMFDREVGPACVTEILEPLLQGAEARLTAHVLAGEVVIADVRGAALALLAPVVLALLHQGPLGGAGCRPLNARAFAHAHVDHFLRGCGIG